MGPAVPDPIVQQTAAGASTARTLLVCFALALQLASSSRAHAAEAASEAAAGVVSIALGELGHGFEAGQRAFLELEVNGVRKGEALVFVRGADYWVDLDALKEAGVQDRGDGERIMIEGRMVIRIGSLAPHVMAELDEAALLLRLTVDPARLGKTVLSFAPPRPRNIQYRRDTSAFVNYGTTLHSNDSHALSLESGVTIGPALFSGYVSGTNDGFIRGPLSVTLDSRRRMERWIAGDSVASGGALGGSTQIAGLNVSRNYSLDPYFVRYPTVGLTGTASAPSTLDVYVNGQLIRREQLPPGTFDLQSLPLPIGANSTRIVIRDAFGREQEMSASYYMSSGLLAPGLHQYQYAVGAERRFAASESWAYGDLVAFALHRVGVSDSLTIGGRFEASADLISGGPQFVTALGRFGELEAAGAWSRGQNAAGYAWSLGYVYTNRAIAFGGSLRGADEHYRTISSRLASLNQLIARESGLTASARVGRRGMVSLSYQGRRYHGFRADENQVSVTGRLRVSTRHTASITVGRSEVGGVVTPWFFAGLSLGIGQRDTVGASTEYRDGQSSAAFQAHRAMPIAEGFGYRLRAETGAFGSIDADLRYQTRTGLYEVRHHELGGTHVTSVTAAGGLVAIGGQVFATRPIQDGFALVRVPGVNRVRTFLSNQQIGRTDPRGNLLVPNLLPYYGNVLSIASEDVPLNRTIRATELTMAPPYRGGVIAEFPVVREIRVSGSIVLRRGFGTIVPSFGRVVSTTPSGHTVESFLGPAGELYLEGLDVGDNLLRIEYSDMTCDVTVVVPDRDEPVIQLGTVTCLLL
ncbi:MAG TPA: fimbria/pilus outer membrane usher protein [Vicinamibacterales bacterium]|nr:fimbria/pilus outer membrane usher protein [Vicinamibacterales bacterium]